MVKKCSKCGVIKPTLKFYKQKGHKDGLCSECKKCRNIIIKKYEQSSIGKMVRKTSKKKYNLSMMGTTTRKKYKQSKQGKESNKRYQQSEKGRIASARVKAKRRTNIKEAPNDLTLNQWHQILNNQNNECNVCKNLFAKNLLPTKDHIVPVIRGGGLTKNNVQALCKFCNSKKGTKTMKELING